MDPRLEGMTSPCRSLLLAAALTSASLGGSLTACTEHATEAPRKVGRSYLVWDMEPATGQAGEGDLGNHARVVPVTRWVKRGADGSMEELGRREGLWIVADGTLWEMGQTTARWKTRGCEFFDGERGSRSAWVTHQSRGVEFRGRDGRRHDLVDARAAALEPDPALPEDEQLVLGDFAQTHQPVASLGSLVILRSDEYSYMCGAHGGVSVSMLAYDLDTGQRVDLVGQGEALGVGATRAASIRAELERQDAWEDDEILLTAVTPQVVDGRLVASLQFTAGTCYACSDGAWDSYTTSVQVQAPRLPRDLEPHAHPPAVVLQALEGVEQAEGFGWSEVPADGPLFREVRGALGGADRA